MEKEIYLKGVSKSYKDNRLFKDVTLKVEKGTTIGIAGPNGCGKSVLYKMICGFEKPDRGTVLVRGKEVGKDFDFPPDVGVIINEPAFLDSETGLNNLLYLAEINNKATKEDILKISDMLDITKDLDKKVKDYSLGMKKKLAIVQSVMENQDILIFDEPFNALDHNMVGEVKKLFKELKEEGKTILLTSHNQSDVDELCDKVYFISNFDITEDVFSDR